MHYKESMMVLTTVPCPQHCVFCPYENDNDHIVSRVPTTESMIAQTEEFLATNEAVEKNGELYIVNSGSFFSGQTRKGYMRWLANRIESSGLGLVVDARADNKLKNYEQEIIALAKASPLTIAVGLEIADDEHLTKLNKGCNLQQYVSIAEQIQSLGADVKAYILVDPPSITGETYRESIDMALKKGFETAHFAIEEMQATRLGISPFFPYKGLSIPESWFPISTTEVAEVANQLTQVTNCLVDYTSRQIHLAHGNFFRNKGLNKPFDVKDKDERLAVRQNVADICEQVFGRQGDISTR